MHINFVIFFNIGFLSVYNAKTFHMSRSRDWLVDPHPELHLLNLWLIRGLDVDLSVE